MRFDNVVVIFVLVERLRLRRRRIFSAANERRGRVESLSEAVAIPSEVVGDEVFVDVAAVAQDAVASTSATRLDVCDDENT